jgi:hypothetical protein
MVRVRPTTLSYSLLAANGVGPGQRQWRVEMAVKDAPSRQAHAQVRTQALLQFADVSNPALQDHVAWAARMVSAAVAVYFAIYGGLNWAMYRRLRKDTDTDKDNDTGPR